ncbi:MAG: restriction endonuclease [Sphingomonadales bacterium]
MPPSQMPPYTDLLWPTLKALKEKGGSASNEELSEVVAKGMSLPDGILDVPHKDGPLSEVDYRATWARTHLKMIEAVENSERGVWSITDFGRRLESENQVRRLVKEKRVERRKSKRQATPLSDNNDDAVEDELSWEEELLAILRGLDPSAFERLCQRLLRESGFTKVEVTGRSGDGGIDGAGVLRVNLLSFHVRFQSKRYSGSVGSSEIRDFRGAMVGRADKGLFITTGRFTKEAEREAVRDGAPAIDLIDGIELCRLLKTLKLGVHTEIVEQVHMQGDFFFGL